MSKTVSLTAVIICNEDSATIAKSIESFIGSVNEEFRLVVVDNASKDGSFDVIRETIKSTQVQDNLGTDEPEKITFNKIGKASIVGIKFKKKRNIPVLLNYAINSTKQDTQFYIFSQRAMILGNFAETAVATLKYNPAVGIVYSDFEFNGETSLLKSFERDDALTMLVPDNFACQAHLFSNEAFDETLATGYNADLFVKTCQNNLLSHIPIPLFKSYDKKYASIKHNYTGSGIWA